MQGIVWLASYPKSGNTWMRAFLANILSGQEDPIPLEKMASFCTGEAVKVWYKLLYGDDFDFSDDKEIARIRTQLQSRLAAQWKVPIFLKTHSYLGKSYDYDIINMDVTLAAIYVVRNPLDVVLSAAPHFDKSIDETIDIMALDKMRSYADKMLVYEKLTDWSTHVKSWTQREHPGLLTIRYEDMLDRPERIFKKVTRFTGAKKTRKEIARAIENSSFKTLKGMESKTGFSEKPEHADSFFRAGKKEQWREKLSEEQIAKIVDQHREQMERFGYVPEGY